MFDSDGRRIGGARIVAVVLLRPDVRRREYRAPNERDYAIVRSAASALGRLVEVCTADPVSPIPMSPPRKVAVRVQVERSP